ncbi:MAG: hypothetical protein A2096_17025 [Spirochaetes bacterium GWF1_41_5]|nr:MAG: hypothetical protein A2096_17025 [Spirochaetes bacterium GWF1_41_5]HBE00969.1 hypothetical protein [Spirochaetia bacterium]
MQCASGHRPEILQKRNNHHPPFSIFPVRPDYYIGNFPQEFNAWRIYFFGKHHINGILFIFNFVYPIRLLN